MLGKAVFVLFVAVVTYLLIRDGKQSYNPDDVKGLRVVVTGSSYGIGAEVAYQLAAMGAKLLVTARTESKLQKVVEKCKELGSPEAYYVPANMYSYENASLVINKAMEKLGGIDLLILNHYGQTYFGGYRYDVKDVESLLVPNLLTYVHMTTLAMDTLKENKGRIAVISSLAALAGGPFIVPYSTTKHALNGFFRSFRHELKYNKTDVSVTICHLGYINTKVAMQFSKHLVEKASPVDECASEIIRSSMAREDRLYFPHRTAIAPILYGLFPGYLEELIRSNYINIGSG